MRRKATDRPKGTFPTWYSAKLREEKLVKCIEDNFTNNKSPLLTQKVWVTKNWFMTMLLRNTEVHLIDGSYIHRIVEIEGDYKKEIKEFCKYFPNLKVDSTLD